MLSAASEAALTARLGQMRAWRAEHPQAPLADIAFTLALGRREMPYRHAVVVGDGEPWPGGVSGRAASVRPAVQFLFSGQGTQRLGMGRSLAAAEPVFRDAFEQCCAFLRPILGRDPREVMWGEDADLLERTEFAQPALFAVEWSLAQLLMAWGIEPAALAGHSIGELTAAAIAGVFSLADALALVAARGRMMQAMPEGAMLAVALAEAALGEWLEKPVEIAAVNGREAAVVSGPADVVLALERRLNERGVAIRRLRTSHAFHSAAMAPAAAAFRAEVARVRLSPPTRPIVSNVTGTWLTAAEATDPDYWARQIRSPVRFGDNLRALADAGPAVRLELGPGHALAALATRETGEPAVPVLDDRAGEPRAVLEAVGRSWVAGVPIDWGNLFGNEERRKLALPTYPFQRERYWIEPHPAASVAEAGHVRLAGWRRAPSLTSTGSVAGDWVLLGADGAAMDALASRLAAAGGRVTRELDPAANAGIVLVSPDYHALVALLQTLPPGAARRVVVIAQGVHDVTGTEPLCPDLAQLRGPILSAPLERPELSCRLIDATAEVDPGLLAAELAATDPPIVALRGAGRWIPDEGTVPEANAGGSPWNGVWLITGGFGHVGGAIARHLARAGARLVLTGRSPIGLAQQAALAELGDAIGMGADCADAPAMRRVIAAAEARFGRIDGVIHAAGVVGEAILRPIALLTPADTAEQFRAKVEGPAAIEAAFGERIPERCIMVSSIAATRARRAWRTTRRPTRISMRSSPPPIDGLAGAGSASALPGGIRAGRGRVSGRARPPRRCRRSCHRRARTEAFARCGADALAPTRRRRPVGRSGRNRTGGAVAGLLGVRQPDGHSDFFALGGDSLIALQLIGRIRQKFGAALAIRDVFDSPTIARLAQRIAPATDAAEREELEL